MLTGVDIVTSTLTVFVVAVAVAAANGGAPPVSIRSMNSHLSNTANDDSGGDGEMTAPPRSGDPVLDEIRFHGKKRLSDNVKPIHYRVLIDPDMERKTFSGHVKMVIDVLDEPADYVYFHAMDLGVENVTVSRVLTDALDEAYSVDAEAPQKVARYFGVPHTQQLFIMRPFEAATRYAIDMDFYGSLDKRAHRGMYLSSYLKADGTRQRLVTTQLEPTYARFLFPCFDEPSKKATFDISVVRPSAPGYLALGNMPVKAECIDHPSVGRTTVHFERTVAMSTYLVAVVVCDFEYVEDVVERNDQLQLDDGVVARNGTPFRVYAKPTQKERMWFALKVGTRLLQAFTDYFQIAYALPKFDMIAIPDFGGGGMENWGLVTYRELALLYDDVGSSTRDKWGVAGTVSHEMAHQWFGNQVTMSWWSDIWLNEGFASYFSSRMVDRIFPEWRTLDNFNFKVFYAMSIDATLNTHPIVQYAETPTEIRELFDSITYAKGASIIRMLENVVGEDTFRNGVTDFLNKHAFGNADTADLIAALEAAFERRVDDASDVAEGESLTDIGLTGFLGRWTAQAGFPVLHLDVVNASAGVYRVRQERYYSFPCNATCRASVEPSPFDYKWDVPLTWMTGSVFDVTNTTVEVARSERDVKRRWLSHEDDNIDVTTGVSTCDDNAWLKFNVNHTGYYRINYPLADWMRLTSVLTRNHLAITAPDRQSLMSDAFAMATAGYLPYKVPLEMTRYLARERDLHPLLTGLGAISGLDDKLMLVSTTSVGFAIAEYVKSLVVRAYDELGWDDVGSGVQRHLRTAVLTYACSVGHEPCLAEAGRRMAGWAEARHSPTRLADLIPPNFRGVVYDNGLRGLESRGGGRQLFVTWHSMLQAYSVEPNAQEKHKLASGLTSVRVPQLLTQLLYAGRNESIVEKQDYWLLITMMSRHSVGWNVAWDYVMSEYDYLQEQFESRLDYVVSSLANAASSPYRLHQLKALFQRPSRSPTAARIRKQTLEKVESNIRWLARHQVTVESWFAAQATRLLLH